MFRRSLLVVFLSLLVLACLVLGVAPGQQGAQPPDADEFADKIVTVYVDVGDPRMGAVLENAGIKEIAGRQFLAGTGADTGNEENWMTGLQVRIAWESVTMYYRMDAEQFEERKEEYRKRQ